MPIQETAAKLGLGTSDLELYGAEIAKIKQQALQETSSRAGRLILVSAITPTPAGEGKTTTSIGLAQGLARLGESVCVALREPSLGPCFGKKGGGTGGGKCEVIPQDRINLHFTGDFHAVTAANNLLAALIDNHLHFNSDLEIDPRRVAWRRVLDVNDRALRNITTGLGGKQNGMPRESGFDITAASEIMAILCLAEDEADLRARLDRTLVAFTKHGQPVTAEQLRASGAMLALLRDALLPNLVATTEGVPALVHGGPFANIAHGCNSVIATKSALRLADWAITEAGFGFDLGAEKFFDIKCRSAGLDTAAVVLVATIRALKLHGGRNLSELSQSDPAAVERGLANLDRHLESIGEFGERPIVALNRFETDTDEEVTIVQEHCRQAGVAFAESDHFTQGGAGAMELARVVMDRAEKVSIPYKPLYQLDEPVPEKIRKIARKMYGATDVSFTKSAKRDLTDIERLGYARLPICMAKTHASLSDDPRLRGRPNDFEIRVQELRINAGAGFLVALTGDIVRMPGLPRQPIAEEIDLVDAEILGMR